MSPTIQHGIMKLSCMPLQNKGKNMPAYEMLLKLPPQKVNYETLLNLLPQKIHSEREAATLLTKFPILRKATWELVPDTKIFCDISDLEAALAFYQGQEHLISSFHVLNLEGEIKNKKVKILPYTAFSKNDIIHLFFQAHFRPWKTSFRQLALTLAKQDIQEYTLEAKGASKFYQRNSFIFIDNMLQTAIDNYNALEDNLSRYVYLARWKSLHLCNPGYIPIVPYEQYWHPLVSAKENDIICEAGPADGRTTIIFCKKLQNKCTVIAFEPDPACFEHAKAACKDYANIHIVPRGLYDFTGTLYINRDDYTKVVKEKLSEEDIECPVTSIDDYFLNSAYKKVDFIKMDIEGAELNALNGAKEILKRDKPDLAVCIYHNQIDFITIPEFLRKLALNYTFYMGHHRPWYAETVIYATAKKEKL